jgi:hypothetical protein
MLEQEKIEEIAEQVAAANLGAANVDHAKSEPTIDSEGQEALRVTIVIPEEAVARLSGDATLDTLVRMRDHLRDAGEERFPIIEYATQKELNAFDDA